MFLLGCHKDNVNVLEHSLNQQALMHTDAHNLQLKRLKPIKICCNGMHDHKLICCMNQTFFVL